MQALLIAASPSERSRSAALLEGAAGALERAGVAARTLALRDLPAEPLLRARTSEAPLREALQQVAQAHAIVLATPIYKAAYSGLLKAFLDLLPQDGLHGKWIWPLATGGSPAHTLALDHSLRPVLDNLGAHQVVPSVYALESQVVFGDGESAASGPRFDADVQRRLDIGATRLAHALESQAHLRERHERAPLSLVRCSA
ncbi:MAG TPA: NADPH-dependent FMN reductase [Burkholderiaceae bacterium]|nr:NADPH-dependent FMN reductase [Burkholderiaceae bacterium]